MYVYRNVYPLQLGCDVIKTEVRSQRWSPLVPSGSSDSSSR